MAAAGEIATIILIIFYLLATPALIHFNGIGASRDVVPWTKDAPLKFAHAILRSAWENESAASSRFIATLTTLMNMFISDVDISHVACYPSY